MISRLTHPRSNGIKTGYWSPNRKDELVERLAEYENTDLMPQDVIELKTILRAIGREWTPADQPPQWEDYILLSFANFSIPLVGPYEPDNDGGGAYYVGDDETSCSRHGLYVNAWMPLPEPYRPDPVKTTKWYRGQKEEKVCYRK